MAAKAWSSQQKAVDEILFQNDAVSLCLLVNRRARTMRVVDFRAGPSLAKRHFVLQLAKREGVEKAYTLVERDEVATWVKMGFTKEGSIPGFYKRSDAWLLGCSVQDAGELPREVPVESEVRIAVRGRLAHTMPLSIPPPPPDDEPAESTEPAIDAAHARAEKTVVQAKKRARELTEKSLARASVSPRTEAEARRAVEKALRAGSALTAFEPFGRDVERRYFSVTSKLPRAGTFELMVSAESQSCFGNTFLELLWGPKNELERGATAACLKALCDKLIAEGTVGCFALGASDDVLLATAFVANGFRRTGLLQGHMVVDGERKDAILWSRKMANPAED